MSARKIILIILILVLGIFIVEKFLNSNFNQSTINDTTQTAPASQGIEQLTNENVVVAYVKQHHRLPDYYLTKKQAREQGWNAEQGNICDVLPGHAIGGDVFDNREGFLPETTGRAWFEADINFYCGHRNADRLLYSSDGLVFVTKDHYKTFQQK